MNRVPDDLRGVFACCFTFDRFVLDSQNGVFDLLVKVGPVADSLEDELAVDTDLVNFHFLSDEDVKSIAGGSVDSRLLVGNIGLIEENIIYCDNEIDSHS